MPSYGWFSAQPDTRNGATSRHSQVGNVAVSAWAPWGAGGCAAGSPVGCASVSAPFSCAPLCAALSETGADSACAAVLAASGLEPPSTERRLLRRCPPPTPPPPPPAIEVSWNAGPDDALELVPIRRRVRRRASTHRTVSEVHCPRSGDRRRSARRIGSRRTQWRPRGRRARAGVVAPAHRGGVVRRSRALPIFGSGLLLVI